MFEVSITRLDRRAIFKARYYFAVTSFGIFELFASKEFLFYDSSFPKYVMRSMPLDTWTLTTHSSGQHLFFFFFFFKSVTFPAWVIVVSCNLVLRVETSEKLVIPESIPDMIPEVN